MDTFFGLVNRFHSIAWSSLLFSAGAVGVWLWLLAWGMRGRQHRCYVRALLIATIYCFVSEYLAIRLGKYHYAPMLLSLPEIEFTSLTHAFQWLEAHKILPPIVRTDFSKQVPLEVALVEAALLLSIFRITHLLFPQVVRGGSRMGAWRWMYFALPLACLNALLAVNLDAILDPVVSGSVSIGGMSAADDFRGVDLWTWHTTEHFRGHWFGIPLANYTAWFAALFAFTLAVRIGQNHLIVGTTTLARGKNVVLQFAQSVGFLVLLLFTVKLALDFLVYGGFDSAKPPASAMRQFTVLIAVLALSVAIAVRWLRRFKGGHPFEPVIVAPQAFLFAYCVVVFAGLLYPRRQVLIPIGILAVVLAVLHVFAAFRATRSRAAVRVAPPGPKAWN